MVVCPHRYRIRFPITGMTPWTSLGFEPTTDCARVVYSKDVFSLPSGVRFVVKRGLALNQAQTASDLRRTGRPIK